tara:strand:- start:397 stop:3627 length:3231 start_codon:yes stop_codon:yes gene_type:complete
MAKLPGKQIDRPVEESIVEAPAAVTEETSVALAEETPVAVTEEAPLEDSTPTVSDDVAPDQEVDPFEYFSPEVGEIDNPVLSKEDQARERLLQASQGAPVRPPEDGPPDTPDETDAKKRLLAASGNIDFDSAMATINAGIADLLDLPADVIISITNALVSGVGLEKALGLAPTGSFRKLFEATGSTLPEGELPQGVIAEALRFLGQSFGGLPYLGRLLASKALQAGGSFIQGANRGKLANILFGPKGTIKEGAKNLGKTLATAAAENPITFLASDAAAGFGAGLGFGAAKEIGVENPSLVFLSTLAGGVTPAVTLQLLKTLRFGTVGVLNSVRKSYFTESGGNKKAAKRAQSLLSDKEATVKQAEIREEIATNKKLRREDPENAPEQFDPVLADDGLLPEFRDALTPAQHMDDLLPLERVIMESNPSLKKKYGEQHEILHDVIVKSFDEGGDVEMTRREFIKQKRYLESLWEDRVHMAKVDAQEEIDALGTGVNVADQSRIVKKHLDLALKDAGDHQKAMWKLTGDTEHVPSGPLSSAWERLLREKKRMSKSSDFKFREDANHLFEQLGHIDDSGNFIRGAMGEVESLQELQAFRSSILDELRGAASKDNSSNKIRILNELQKTIIHMMEDAETTIVMVKNKDGVWEAKQPSNTLLRAIAVSRQFNEDFNQGIIREVLSTNADGSPSVPINQTLENIFSGSPQEQADNFTQLLKAIAREQDPAQNALIGQDLDPVQIQPVIEASKAYIKSFFMRNFAFKGEIGGERVALKWIESNRESLKQIPGLLNELKSAVRSGNALTLMESESKSVQALLINSDRAAAVRFIEMDAGLALDKTASINLQKNRIRDAKILKRRAQRDTSGEAYRGLRQSVMDWILENSFQTGHKNLTADDSAFVSGARMATFLKLTRNKDIIDTILTPEDLIRLGKILKSAQKYDLIRGSKPLQEIVSKGWVAATAGRLGGARLGNWLNNRWGGAGGGDIQTPSALAKLLSKFAESVFKDFPKSALMDAFTSPNSAQLDNLLTLPTSPEKVAKLQNAFSIWFAKIVVLYNINVADFEDPENLLEEQLQMSEESE